MLIKTGEATGKTPARCRVKTARMSDFSENGVKPSGKVADSDRVPKIRLMTSCST